MNWLVILVCVVAVVVTGRPAGAQSHVTSWTVDDGLPQNAVTAIHQARDGYLWVATLDGLARFDGVRFTVFNRANSPGITNNRFTSLFEDGSGDLWLGTETGNITRYTNGRFVTYSTANGLPLTFVRGFTGDADGNVWVLSGDVIRQWQPAREQFIEAETPPPGGYKLVRWSRRGAFWTVDRGELLLFSEGHSSRYPAPVSLPGFIIEVAEAQDGGIWLGFSGNRIGRLDRPTADARQTTWRNRYGTTWVMDVSDQLRRSLTLASAGRADTIPFDVAYEDREGNLWLGSDGQGLHRVKKDVVTVYSTGDGLIDRNIYPIYEDRAGAIWIGAWSGGLSRYQDGRFTNYTTKDGLAPGAVTALHEDRDGVLWVATQAGIQQFRDGRFSATIDQIVPNGTGVAVIHQDREGALWFGTARGLVRYHRGEVRIFTTRDGLPSDNVRVIIDGDAGLWIGCYGGLARWQDGALTAWTERDGLPGNMLRALYQDRDGTLWIGSYDSGLGRLRDGTFTRYTTRDGLFDDGVFQVLEDGRGNLWMSSNRGVFRVRKQELDEVAAGKGREFTSIAYGKADGMLNVECNGGLWPAGVKARDGRLWFPTQDGAAVIDPESIVRTGQPPPVMIESLLIDRTPIDRALFSAATSSAPVRVEPDQESLEIQYTGLSFSNAEQLKFRYRLAGLDREWVDAGTRRIAYYSHPPPGRYVFTVIAANADGEWNTSGASVVLEVLPPFYRTWWFLASSVLAVTSLLIAGYRSRVAQLMRAQEAQQAFSRELIVLQERERQRIAGELHDSLGQSLAIIKNRALLSLSVPEDHDRAQDQLREIASAAGDVITEVKEIAHNLRPYQLDQLGLAKTIEGMVKTIEATHGLPFTLEIDRVDGLLPPDAEINLFRILQESVNNIVKHANATRAAVRVAKNGHTIDVTIEDNGRGFDRDHPPPLDHKKRGFGLIGMAERARLLGAVHRIRVTPGAGTTITLSIDVANQPWHTPPSES